MRGGEKEGPKTWVVYLEPVEGGFSTAKIEQVEEGLTFREARHPHILVPAIADVKDEIGAFMYAKRILDNLRLNEGRS